MAEQNPAYSPAPMKIFMSAHKVSKNVWAILLAAGNGTRMGTSCQNEAKQFLLWQGRPLYWHSAKAFSLCPIIKGIVFVFPAHLCLQERQRLQSLYACGDLGLPYEVTGGGKRRQDSVRLGLMAMPSTATHVVIHDAARPFLKPARIYEVCDALSSDCKAASLALPVTDTVKICTDATLAEIKATLPRSQLVTVQTPQAFDAGLLLKAHEMASLTGMEVTDDAELMEKSGHKVKLVPGDAENKKITFMEDLALLKENDALPKPCTGFGYDVHAFEPGGRPLRLGGITIPKAPQVRAHSDGDVLLHALMDAILGCAGMGDIGELFPDDKAEFDGISSVILLEKVLSLVQELELCSVDLTIIAQQPRLSPYKKEIKKNVSRLLKIPETWLSLKATTEEKLGFTGRMEGIKAVAVVSALRRQTRV